MPAYIKASYSLLSSSSNTPTIESLKIDLPDSFYEYYTITLNDNEAGLWGCLAITTVPNSMSIPRTEASITGNNCALLISSLANIM